MCGDCQVALAPKLAGVADFFGSLEGLYFLRRGLFIPTEIPELLRVDMARGELARLGGFPPGMTSAQARDGVSAVGLLESTHYLCNQLLCDSDWASMGPSLELRTPLVDAALLETMGPYVSSFAGNAGKAMLGQSPEKHLPAFAANRPQSGFSVPMAKWLSGTTSLRAWDDLPLLAAPGTPWARRWARAVVERMAVCE